MNHNEIGMPLILKSYKRAFDFTREKEKSDVEPRNEIISYKLCNFKIGFLKFLDLDCSIDE